jgi:hypothetical protein
VTSANGATVGEGSIVAAGLAEGAIGTDEEAAGAGVPEAVTKGLAVAPGAAGVTGRGCTCLNE